MPAAAPLTTYRGSSLLKDEAVDTIKQGLREALGELYDHTDCPRTIQPSMCLVVASEFRVWQ
jgi:hypothetical protein